MRSGFKTAATLLLCAALTAACGVAGGTITSTSSLITVVGKEHAEDDSQQWIVAYDPNNQSREDAFKIVVEEPMVWNLIEVEESYFSSYGKKGDDDYRLQQIEHFGEEDPAK